MIDDLNSFIISAKYRLILSSDISRRIVLKRKKKEETKSIPDATFKKIHLLRHYVSHTAADER